MGRKMNKVVEKDSLWWHTCGKCNPSVGLLLLSKRSILCSGQSPSDRSVSPVIILGSPGTICFVLQEQN